MLRFRPFTRPLVSVFSAEEEKIISRRYAGVESGLLNNASKRISAQALCATLTWQQSKRARAYSNHLVAGNKDYRLASLRVLMRTRQYRSVPMDE